MIHSPNTRFVADAHSRFWVCYDCCLHRMGPMRILVIFAHPLDDSYGATLRDMIDLARSARAPRRDIMMKVRFPNALPSLFAGAKIGISFALIGAIVGEFVAGEQGLGYVILTSQATFNSIRAFAAIVVLGVLGTIMFFMIEAVERWMLPWHVSQRSQKGR